MAEVQVSVYFFLIRRPAAKVCVWFVIRKLGKLDLNSHANANATSKAVVSTGTLGPGSNSMGPVPVAEDPGQIFEPQS